MKRIRRRGSPGARSAGVAMALFREWILLPPTLLLMILAVSDRAANLAREAQHP